MTMMLWMSLGVCLAVAAFNWVFLVSGLFSKEGPYKPTLLRLNMMVWPMIGLCLLAAYCFTPP